MLTRPFVPSVRGFAVLVALAALVALRPGPARAAEPLPLPPGIIQEIGLPASSDYPWQFAFGPEEGIWYTEGSERLERATQGGIQNGIFEVQFGQNMGSPERGFYGQLIRGSDGAMWFTETGFEYGRGEVLGRITPTGGVTEKYVTPPGGSIGGLARGPNAAVWFTASNSGGEIGRVTSEGEVKDWSVPTGTAPDRPAVSEPGPLIEGPDGNMWFIDWGTNSEGHSLVGRVTPTGEIREFPLPQALYYSGSLAAGPAGAIWIGTTPGTVYAVKPDGSTITYTPPRITGNIEGLAAGPEGNLWYGNGSVLGRLTPTGEGTLFAEPRNWGSPMLGPDGRLWFTAGKGFAALAPPLAPVLLAPPTISGEPVDGHFLTATSGEWANTPSTFSYQWSVCDATGANCEWAIGETGHSIALLAGEVGKTLRFGVRASGAGGTGTTISAPSAVVRSAPVTGGGSGQLNSYVKLDPTLGTTVTWQFGWSRRGTAVKALHLHGIPAGGEVEIRCRAHPCGFSQRRYPAARRKGAEEVQARTLSVLPWGASRTFGSLDR